MVSVMLLHEYNGISICSRTRIYPVLFSLPSDILRQYNTEQKVRFRNCQSSTHNYQHCYSHSTLAHNQPRCSPPTSSPPPKPCPSTTPYPLTSANNRSFNNRSKNSNNSAPKPQHYPRNQQTIQPPYQQPRQPLRKPSYSNRKYGHQRSRRHLLAKRYVPSIHSPLRE